MTAGTDDEGKKSKKSKILSPLKILQNLPQEKYINCIENNELKALQDMTRENLFKIMPTQCGGCNE